MTPEDTRARNRAGWRPRHSAASSIAFHALVAGGLAAFGASLLLPSSESARTARIFARLPVETRDWIREDPDEVRVPEVDFRFSEPDALEPELVELPPTAEPLGPEPRPELPPDPAFDWRREHADRWTVTARAEPEPTETVEEATTETTPAPAEPEALDAPEASEPASTGPVLLHGPAPVYPRASVRLSETGTVRCHIRVAADGSVLAVEVAESSGFERLDEAALAALRAWSFAPATERGVAVPGSFEHEVVFRLVDEP